MSYDEFMDSYNKAGERIVDRHKGLTWLQKRGGRKGARTAEIRQDYLRFTVHRQVRLDEVFPRVWRDRMPEVVSLSRQGKVDLVIGKPVLVTPLDLAPVVARRRR